MASSTRISPYSLSDLKNTTDDALPNYLTSINFTPSHTLTDIRLLLGYTAVIIASLTFIADYRLGWDATKNWTAVAVVAYFALNAAFTWWIWGVEKGVVFVGSGPEGGKLTLSSRTQKHSPFYHLTARFTPPSSSTSSKTSKTAQPQELELKAPFALWFTADGYFSPKPFQQWLASSVAVIGAADPANVVVDGAMDAAAGAGAVDGRGGKSGKSGAAEMKALDAKEEKLEDVLVSASGAQAQAQSEKAKGKGKGKARKR